MWPHKLNELKQILVVLDEISAKYLGTKIKEYGLTTLDTKKIIIQIPLHSILCFPSLYAHQDWVYGKHCPWCQPSTIYQNSRVVSLVLYVFHKRKYINRIMFFLCCIPNAINSVVPFRIREDLLFIYKNIWETNTLKDNDSLVFFYFLKLKWDYL